MVVAEGFGEFRVDLVGAHAFDLFGREQAVNLCADLRLALLQIIVERVAKECALCFYHHYGHFKELHAFAEALRKRCFGAVKAVARLGEHYHAALQGIQHVVHIFYERGFGDELLRGNAADRAHQAFFADEAVICADDIVRAILEDRTDDLQVGKARMVHQDQRGSVLRDLFHILLCIGKISLLQLLCRELRNERTPHRELSRGLFMLCFRKRADLGKCLIRNLYLHKRFSPGDVFGY